MWSLTMCGKYAFPVFDTEHFSQTIVAKHKGLDNLLTKWKWCVSSPNLRIETPSIQSKLFYLELSALI